MHDDKEEGDGETGRRGRGVYVNNTGGCGELLAGGWLPDMVIFPDLVRLSILILLTFFLVFFNSIFYLIYICGYIRMNSHRSTSQQAAMA